MIGLLTGALLDVRSKPLRTIAAIAGMVVAIIAVVLVNSANALSHRANEEYLARQFGLPATMHVYMESGAAPAHIEAGIEAALEDNGVLRSLQVGVTASVVSGNGARFASFLMVSPEYDQIRIVDLVAGSWPRDVADSRTPRVVISTQLAASLGYEPEAAVGQTFLFAPNVAGAQFDLQTSSLELAIIEGVASSTTNALQFADLLLVTTEPRRDLMRPEQPLAWLLRVQERDYGVVAALISTFRSDRGNAFYSAVRDDRYEQLAPVLDQQDVTAIAVSLVALIVGGLGILSAGVAGVRERSAEFGLRRALGSSRERIFASVIVQTLLESLIAAAVAIPVAVILVALFTRRLVLESLPLPADQSVPVEAMVIGLMGAVTVGLVAGVLPAINAARVSVIRALRG